MTKYDSRYGNVTYAENPYVGTHVITPIFEKLPEPDYIQVDTPYRKVNATKEAYEMMGKDQIAAGFKEFIEMRNQLIKTGKIKPGISSSDTDSTILAEQTNPISIISSSPSSTLTVSPNPSPREDMGYWRKTGYYPRYI